MTTTKTERAIARRHAVHAAVCDRIEPWAHGTLVVATRFPTYWDYNSLRVEGVPPAGLTAEALAAEADRRQAGLAHRKVEIEATEAGAALRPGFEALGWDVERLAWMAHDGSPGVASPRVAVVPAREIEGLRREWLSEEAMDPEHARVEAEVAALLPGELVTFAARDPAGDPAAYATLRLGGDGSAEIEDVYCTPNQRGRGLAGALVGTAVAHAQGAGAREIWIGADDEDFPKRLYERHGFQTAWVRHDAVRRPTT